MLGEPLSDLAPDSRRNPIPDYRPRRRHAEYGVHEKLSEGSTPDQQGQLGFILSGGAAVTAFKRKGWKWGGDWNSKKDYQHFSKDGR
jgi:hypothetical protein